MSVYATPRIISDVKDCYFYHSMNLPGIGTVVGNWDLNKNIDGYLGYTDFRGKRVLDVGCASGALSFHMERQGAEVVSYDMDKSIDWDMVPFVKWEHFDHISKERKLIIDRLNNSYWFAHRLLNSKAKVVYGTVYAIPDAIGPVNIAVFGSILIHLRDPFLALQNGLKLTKETVIISDVLRGGGCNDPSYLGFLPDARTLEPKDTWWDIRPEWIMRAIGVLGFEDAEVSYHTQEYEGEDNHCFTVVGKRTHGKVG